MKVHPSNPRGTPELDLFSNETPREKEIEAPARQSSQTSKAAARKIQSHSLAMRQNVYTSIVAAGERGITRKELESVTGYLTQTLCARLNEMEELGDNPENDAAASETPQSHQSFSAVTGAAST